MEEYECDSLEEAFEETLEQLENDGHILDGWASFDIGFEACEPRLRLLLTAKQEASP